MKNKLLKQNPRDIALPLVLLAGLALLCAKLVLASAQQVFLWPEEAVLDENVMYDGARSITNGGWLGEYGWKTLSKHSFFALWLAGLHALGIPFLLGGQLLWAAAAIAAAWAFAPALKRNWAVLLLFAVLLFSPSSTANPAPLGYITRVYRDNIFPALCLLCVAGMAGYVLRATGRLRRGVGWLVVAGLAFAACCLTREDGWWLLPFLVGGAVVALVVLLRQKALWANKKALLARCGVLLIPFVLFAAGDAAWRGANLAVYGRFIVSDFSGGEFADAYGAMTRVTHEHWQSKADVPLDVRRQLYDKVPAFAPFEALLESEGYLNRYAGDAEYSSGSFYWALREAAAALGHYENPETARAFWAGLASAINALCDTGEVAAGGRRSSVNPPIRAEYIGPVLAETAHSLVFCATFMQCEPYSLFSPGGNSPVFYAETLAPMEDYLHEKALTATMENSDKPYYTPWQGMMFKLLEAVRWGYAVLLPPALMAALVWQVWEAFAVFAGRRKSRAGGKAGPRPALDGGRRALRWWLLLGVLACVVLRCAMVAFVSVSSFGIGTYVMYLASVHPLMLLYAFVGTAGLAGKVNAKFIIHNA